MGHGQGYRYPHDFAGHYVAEDYLPDALVGERIYRPSDSGFEAELASRLVAAEDRKKSRQK
jgi:putative ATPase